MIEDPEMQATGNPALASNRIQAVALLRQTPGKAELGCGGRAEKGGHPYQNTAQMLDTAKRNGPVQEHTEPSISLKG